MNFKFEYDHSKLSAVKLRKSGIRSLGELEEVIEWESSICTESTDFSFPLYRFVGLTKGCLGLEIAVSLDEVGRFITLDAIISDRNEFFENFLKG